VTAFALISLSALLGFQISSQQERQPSGTVSSCASRLAHLPKQSDFSVSRSNEKVAKSPVLATKRDHLYRTTIRNASARGPNFAGHYAVAESGCGIGCRQFAVVDLHTGIVYDTQFQEVDYHYPTQIEASDPSGDPAWWCYPDALNYDVSSGLLVVEGCLDGKQCGRNYFVMESDGLRNLRYDPDLLKDGSLAPF
jgi:hypothetical protein